MGNEKYKKDNWLLIGFFVAIILAIFLSYWGTNNSVNQRIDGLNTAINQRIDDVNTRISELNMEIGKMNKEEKSRFTAIESRFTDIEKGISSLQEPEKPVPADEPSPDSGPETIPYQEGESGPETSPYQSP